MQLPNNLVCRLLLEKKKVQDIGRSDLVPLEYPLHLDLGFDRRHAHRSTRLTSRPVEFGFGIDHHDDHRELFGRPVDCLPCARVEHASPECSTAYLFGDETRALRLDHMIATSLLRDINLS